MKRRVPGVIGMLVGISLTALLYSPGTAFASVSPTVGSGHAASPTRNETADNARLLTLRDVVDRAAIHHPDVIKAEEALIAAERELATREAAFSPRASLDSTPVNIRMQRGNLRQDSPTLRFSANHSSRIGLSTSASVSLSLKEMSLTVPSWNVGLSYPLFRSAELNSNNLSVRQAEIGLETAYRNRAQAEVSAVVDAIQLYHSAIIAGTRLEQAIDTLAEVRDSSEAVFHRLELGMVSDIDRIAAETELRQHELATVQAERTYHNRMRALLTAIGFQESLDSYTLANWPHLTPPLTNIAAESLVQQASQFDTALWQREVAIETAKLQLRAELEKGRLEGSVSGSLGQGQSQSQSGSNQPVDPAFSWTVQLQLSYPLADGGSRENALYDRAENLRQAEEAYADELIAFEQRMQQLFDQLHDAYVNAELAELALEKAEIELAITEAGHSRGFNTELDVKRIERAVERAYDDMQAAVLDVYVALWNLEEVAGMDIDLSALLTLHTEGW